MISQNEIWSTVSLAGAPNSPSLSLFRSVGPTLCFSAACSAFPADCCSRPLLILPTSSLPPSSNEVTFPQSHSFVSSCCSSFRVVPNFSLSSANTVSFPFTILPFSNSVHLPIHVYAHGHADLLTLL